MDQEQLKEYQIGLVRKFNINEKLLNIFIGFLIIIFILQGLNIISTSMFGCSINNVMSNKITLLTSMILHGDIMHLVTNCFSIYILAPLLCMIISIETKHTISSIILLITICIITGLAGNSAFLYEQYLANDPNQIGIGISGAIFGFIGIILGWMLRLLFAEKTLKQNGYIIESGTRNILASLSFIIFINIGIGLVNPTIALSAHIGGFIAGFLMGIILFMRTLKDPIDVFKSLSILQEKQINII